MPFKYKPVPRPVLSTGEVKKKNCKKVRKYIVRKKRGV